MEQNKQLKLDGDGNDDDNDNIDSFGMHDSTKENFF